MNDTNPLTGFLNNLVQAAGNIIPRVLGDQQTVSAGVPNAAGTASSAPPADTSWIKWAIGGGVALLALVLVLAVVKK